jgi:hypothetical protein
MDFHANQPSELIVNSFPVILNSPFTLNTRSDLCFSEQEKTVKSTNLTAAAAVTTAAENLQRQY